MGLMDDKRLATRQALTNAATKLFLERGYDSVTVVEIAAEARTAVGTLFSYFPDGKDAIIFGREDRQTAFRNVLDQRASGQSVLDAAESYMLSRAILAPDRGDNQAAVEALVMNTPALRRYVQQQWAACEPIFVAAATTEAGGLESPAIRSLANFVLAIPALAAWEASPREFICATFLRLRRGWQEFEKDAQQRCDCP